MYCEVYLDSFFLLQFCLNMYLLGLVNHLLYDTASFRRILLGALLGAVCSVVPFLLSIRIIYCMLLGFLLSGLGMSVFTFRIVRLKALMEVLEKMFVVTLLLGGILLILLRLLPDTKGTFWGMIGVLSLGAVSYAAVGRLTRKHNREENVCKVTLQGSYGVLKMEALLDTGNSLSEPISGEPVAVLGKEASQKLLGENTSLMYRAIPYRSVGKRNGILKGYQIEKMVVELHGVKKDCGRVYVAVCEELLAENSVYQMILNPRIIEKQREGMRYDDVEIDAS